MKQVFEQELDALAARSQKDTEQPLHSAQRHRIAQAAVQKIGAQQAGRTIRLAEHAQPRRRPPLRRWAALAVAAACALTLAVGAGAAGILGQAAPGFWEKLFPNAAGSTPQAGQTQSLVQDNLVYDGSSLTVDDYTFTVLNHMIDSNGNGCIYYSVENPAGIGDLYTVYTAGRDGQGSYCGILDTELDSGTHAIVLEQGDTAVAGRHYRDDANSTDTCWYVYSYFTIASPDAAARDIDFTVYPMAYPTDGGEIDPARLTLPTAQPLTASLTGSDGGNIHVSLSAIGLKIQCDTFDEAVLDYAADAYVALEYADGSRYVLWDEAAELRDYGYGCYGSWETAADLHVRYVFDRIVDPAQVAAVWINTARIAVS